MKRILKLLLIGFGAISTGCSTGSSTGEDIVKINLKANIDCADTNNAEDVFAVMATICPSVTDSTLLGYPKIAGLDGDMIYIFDSRAGFMVFDQNDGHCISSFSHKGNGPGEYSDLSEAWKDPEADGWTALDLSSKNIFGYTYKGVFKYMLENDSISDIYPCGDGWVASNSGLRNDYQVYWYYSSDWKKLGTLETGLRYKKDDFSCVVPTKVVCDSRTYLIENDTVYDISDRSLNVRYTIESGNDYSAALKGEKDTGKNIIYRAFFNNSFTMVCAMKDEMCRFQIYSLYDGKLLFSSSCELSNYRASGFPVTINGKQTFGLPMEYADGENFYLFVSAEKMADITGNEDSNPAIVKISIKG